MQDLVIVESPTKARTLQKFLGDKYRIEASMGHIRDLPKSELGVDVEHNFEPQYVIPRDKKKRVNELKKLSDASDKLYLATDPDREGEAIAWHIAHVLGKKQEDMARVEFHEITESAIKDAFAHPREVDLQLVNAQQARRILDRLVGYKLSPLLWQKIKKGLSAGRVQSVALRLIVEREKEVLAFKADEYWNIEAELQGESGKGKGESFVANLIEKDGKKLEIKNQDEADEHLKNLEKAAYSVSKVTQKGVRRFPYPPFTTSTLQQASANKLGMSAKKTMMIAQNLYEHGFITYMRTDSVNLSTQAIDQVRNYIESSLGKIYLPKTPRVFKSKSKNAQEAHEAIRVTDVKLKGEALKGNGNFNRDHIRLYDLIWKRFVACQMSEALMDQTSVDIQATGNRQQAVVTTKNTNAYSLTPNAYTFRSTGSVVKFDGWLKLYGKEDEDDKEDDNKVQSLPKLTEKQLLNLLQLLPGQHFTEPPPRYNEASLIKKLEELGIGRPSTYAPTLSTIQDRFYVEKIERKFIPTKLGFTVSDFLMEYFPNLFDYSFTALMEDNLDEIARGERKWKPTIEEFYIPFAKQLEKTAEIAKKVKMEVELVDKYCPECKKQLMIRVGKFGKFLACSGFPECKHTEGLEEKVNAQCPEDGGDIMVRKTRHGKTFYGCKNWPTCKFASWTKPKEGSRQQAVGESNAKDDNSNKNENA